ncbi:YecA family protein [Clostridium vincentii]|uniref:Preprotein translocase subunit SecA n=1 Tax=Clostridium vincentii TaxID=52704 RepID=A0A2T0BDP1_9CLOT|nr:SEC-C metal-binding domain-containing protein [Clostridium vincentii]PRR82010.1 hypothetical protein CLVI_20750 [Clostridium vincentii]
MKDLINDEYTKLRKEIMIFAQPVEEIRLCLSFYTKPQLSDIAIRYGITNTRAKKAIVIDTLADAIVELLCNDLKYENIDEIKRLYTFCTNKVKTDDIDTVTDMLKYRYKGWMYLFTTKGKKEFNIVVPDEIRVHLAELLEDEEKMNVNAKYQEMLKYSKSLNNLYGVYQREQFLTVWNKYHEEALNVSELEDFLVEAQDRLGFFFTEGEYLIDGGFSDNSEYENLLDEAKNKPYYMPEKSEIDMYENEIVDVNSDYYKAVKQYLRKKIKDDVDLDDILFEMETVCVFEASTSEIMNLIDEFGVTFHDLKDGNNFMKLYVAWHNHTRVWSNRGYTPAELSDLLKNESGVQVSQTKVGRNDPCPCGSGKKYKKCCGK